MLEAGGNPGPAHDISADFPECAALLPGYNQLQSLLTRALQIKRIRLIHRRKRMQLTLIQHRSTGAM